MDSAKPPRYATSQRYLANLDRQAVEVGELPRSRKRGLLILQVVRIHLRMGIRIPQPVRNKWGHRRLLPIRFGSEQRSPPTSGALTRAAAERSPQQPRRRYHAGLLAALEPHSSRFELVPILVVRATGGWTRTRANSLLHERRRAALKTRPGRPAASCARSPQPLARVRRRIASTPHP